MEHPPLQKYGTPLWSEVVGWNRGNIVRLGTTFLQAPDCVTSSLPPVADEDETSDERGEILMIGWVCGGIKIGGIMGGALGR